MSRRFAPVLARRPCGPRDVVLTVAWSGATPAPFQFFMLSAPDDPSFPFLPRPFSVFDHRPGELDFLVRVVGRGTHSLAERVPGERVLLWGPLGRPVGRLPARPRPILVAGGVGIAPFYLLLRLWRDGGIDEPTARPLLLYGARTAADLVEADRFEALGVELELATEDGGRGRRGRVTDLLERRLRREPEADVLACGPDAMMTATARLCASFGVRCRLSLETPMACGYGVCNACAVRVTDGGERYERCCVEGTVFDAARLDLDALEHAG